MKDIRNLCHSYYKGKKIVITGASGYIGSSIAKVLSDINCRLVLLTRNTESCFIFKKTRASIQVIQFDILKEDNWDKIIKGSDIIFHFAAQTSSKLSNSNPLLDYGINVLPILNIIESAKKQKNMPDIIFSGTVTEVGITRKIPVDENFKDFPITVYDINKLTAEKYLQLYSVQGGKSVTLRLSNIYGPSFSAGALDRNIVNNMIKRALNNEALTVYGKGNFIRDYVYIEDVVNAFLLAGINIKKLSGKYYIVSTGKGTTFVNVMNLIAKQVKKDTGKDVKIEHVKTPKGLSLIEFRSFIGDSSAFIKETNWNELTLLDQGIKETVNFFNK